MKKKKGVTTDRCAYWFIAPYYIFFLLFVLFPIVVNVGLSFTDFNLKTISFTGIKNYIALFHDGLFWKSVQNTFIYVVFTVFMTLILGFVLALALNSAALWGTRFSEALFIFHTSHPWFQCRWSGFGCMILLMVCLT